MLAVVVAVTAVRSSGKTMPLFEQTIEKSSQLAVRWIVVLVFALALLASELGLDLLLGGFAAGVITRQVLKEREVPGFDSKLTAVAFGVFIPFFFVVSGMQLDVAALFASPSGVAKMFLFFVLFLVVRGTPAMLLYGDVLNRRDRLSLAFFTSTQLPLVLAITTLARETGHMRASTAASLVGAAVLSTLVFPMVGLKLRAGRAGRRAAAGSGRGHGLSDVTLVDVRAERALLVVALPGWSARSPPAARPTRRAARRRARRSRRGPRRACAPPSGCPDAGHGACGRRWTRTACASCPRSSNGTPTAGRRR